ncbi:hypothetical protein SERLA73DRAFT_161860 [Serpula lacrymans var. lacrymans S7.3]|uniref:Uncharacterized protein n=2 Tax=Serpula lacrymans var. lacrymans TaxID=341189 RepID=F8Q440_SERL3|nr:uncharacterized protein SERLADRAFT_416944 [Serpula lacrymans var. lacrymans S7.9]EGN96896.1 hypothetical protein SERLA73DRAFT_161860 [Serpula lacrymans var. lacrymans S7.3]EGO22494.1 hypothetical protein SERLADRAFT_416944 [Serpula lacrymans var. lacrymans S7.9]
MDSRVSPSSPLWRVFAEAETATILVHKKEHRQRGIDAMNIMAQAVFEGHPLEEYFIDCEVPVMPGGCSGFALAEHSDTSSNLYGHSENLEKLCYLIFEALEMIGTLFSCRVAKGTSQFAERFKYDVISSTLLSPSLSTSPHPHRRSLSPSIPGKLGSSHSRNTSSTDSSMAFRLPDQELDQSSASLTADNETPLWPLTLTVTFAVAALSAKFYFLAILSLATTSYYVYVHNLDVVAKPDIMKPSIEALQDLVSAGQIWGSVFQDAFDILESEEPSSYGVMTPSSPSSPLRIALHSSLLTTQTQCDNVRQLLSALTSPSELAQLSEMYAPPSPVKPTFSLNDTPRPQSLPESRQRTSSVPDRKRSTWNGSYSALALAGSPTFHMVRRREKRRSDLSALLEATSPSRRSSISAPSSPCHTKTLPDVQEEGDQQEQENTRPPLEEDEYFGAAALTLQRKRKSGGLETLSLSSRNSFASLSRSNSDPKRSSGSSGSRFTLMQTTRHPLSLSSLHQALQGATASKRYACSHLLALRFEDDEDEGYWEDVRSVMGLLTSTFVDASSRLSEAFDELDEQKLKDQDTASESSVSISRSGSMSPIPESSIRHLSQTHPGSFAPMPSQVSRFAAHVDTISSAINDARDNLEQCVAALKVDSSAESTDDNCQPHDVSQDHPALQAYERLRRELGLALRECERGRERLIDIVFPPKSSSSEEEADDLPALGPDAGTDESDKADFTPPMLDMFRRRDEGDSIGVTIVSPDGEEIDTDDVSSHLLLTTSSQHLPPRGIEQIFEGETELNVPFMREKSKLTREERIKLARAKRDSKNSNDGLGSESQVERWGPGGEVVQELKDVIWKVVFRVFALLSYGINIAHYGLDRSEAEELEFIREVIHAVTQEKEKQVRGKQDEDRNQTIATLGKEYQETKGKRI